MLTVLSVLSVPFPPMSPPFPTRHAPLVSAGEEVPAAVMAPVVPVDVVLGVAECAHACKVMPAQSGGEAPESYWRPSPPATIRPEPTAVTVHVVAVPRVE